MRAILNHNIFQQIQHLVDQHGEHLKAVHVTKEEMKQLISGRAEVMKKFIPDYAELREVKMAQFRNRTRECKVMHPEGQKLYDALEQVERDEHAFKEDVPKELLWSNGIAIRVTMTGQ